jgi:DNA-binding transcriptional LysR family regulator
MNIHDLEAFVAVVETGSIVGASARLNLMQPGVTRRVQNLEERLGAALLDRQSKPLKLTSAERRPMRPMSMAAGCCARSTI